jgi:hypothetical protein
VLKVGPGRFSLATGQYEPMPFEPGDKIMHSGAGAWGPPEYAREGLVYIPANIVVAKLT